MDTQNIQQQLKQFEDLMARFQRMNFHAMRKETNLTTSQVFILRFLDKCPQAKASDVAKVSGLSPGAVTQVCDELVKFGYIERTRSNDDRRVVHIALTAAGATQIDIIRKLRSEQIAKILAQLGTEDAQEFIRIIGRVVEIVETNAKRGD
jgi:DNA-binding MarR family transcriptional regulator